jgi:hypothetical protein
MVGSAHPTKIYENHTDAIEFATVMTRECGSQEFYF